MKHVWTLLKRRGGPLAKRVGLATPLLLGACMLLVLIGIWWLGPQWFWRGQQPLASVAHRTLLSLALLLVPLVVWLSVLRAGVRRLQAQRRQVEEQLADPQLPFVHAQERWLDQELKHLLGNTGGRRSLYRLPWYLMVGTEQAGKSRFIESSSQRFSLTQIRKAQALGRRQPERTPAVGWWISDDAVILDPPGGYIGQGAGNEDQQAEPATALPAGTQARLWSHLLDWLVRNRSRRALNGVLLVVDLPALLHASPAQRTVLAQVLRTRLHDVSRQLGARLPLYVVLSKFDLLEGFDQLYTRLSPAQREQILGFTFKLDAVGAFDAWLEAFADAYEKLANVLHEQVLDQLPSLNDAASRARLLSLHAQLLGLRPMLSNFLHETLGSDRFTTPALVRGVYWSSVVQQGAMLNAFVREAAHPYRTRLPLTEGKAPGKDAVYFSQHLLARVVFKEAGLAGDNLKVARRKRQWLWVSAAAGMCAFGLAMAGWHRYFDINQGKAIGVLAKSQEYSRHAVDQGLDPTGRNLLQPLDLIRNAVAVFGDYRAAWPLVADLGLYQGRVIGPRVDDAYLSLLSRRFLPALASGVVDAMLAAAPGSEQQMAALRVYRMLEDRGNRRPAWVEEWMARQWQVAFPGQGQLQRDLMQHLKYALAYADTELPQYRQPVDEVQRVLREVPVAQRVYAGLKQEAQEQMHTGLSLRQQVGPAFDVVYQASAGARREDDSIILAPMLTAKGFRDYFQPRRRAFTDMAMIDQWALGERGQLDYSDADREALVEQVRILYGADYVDSWRRALSAFAVADFVDLDHGVMVLEQMTGPAAPLQRLLQTVRDNTALSATAALEGADEASALKRVNEGAGQLQAPNIRQAFSALNAMLQANGEKPSYYDETLMAIAAVHDYARAVQASPDRGKAALQAVLQRFSMTGQDPIGALRRVATGLPEPIDRQARKLADQTAQVLNVEALRELERRWDAEVYSFFQQRLAGRYPFVVRAPDASLEDFEAFFGPRGRLQLFQDQYLKVFLQDNFEALQAGQQGQSLIRRDVIEQLALADRIRETFFDPRGNLSVQFNIEPLGLSTNQRTSLLDLDGQLIPYSHGPSQIIGVVWPNTQGQRVRSNLTLLRLNGNSSSLEYRGPWSMFRLLSRGALNGRTATSVDLSFRTGDGVMRYRLNAEKAFNPITQQPFKGFRLPRGLLRPSLEVAQVGPGE